MSEFIGNYLVLPESDEDFNNLTGWVIPVNCPKTEIPDKWFFCPHNNDCPVEHLRHLVRAAGQKEARQKMKILSVKKDLGNCLYNNTPFQYSAIASQPLLKAGETLEEYLSDIG